MNGSIKLLCQYYDLTATSRQGLQYFYENFGTVLNI